MILIGLLQELALPDALGQQLNLGSTVSLTQNRNWERISQMSISDQIKQETKALLGIMKWNEDKIERIQ